MPKTKRKDSLPIPASIEPPDAAGRVLFASYRAAYLTCVRSIAETQVIATLSARTLQDFPKKLPEDLRKPTVELLRGIGKAILAAVGEPKAEGESLDAVPQRSPIEAKLHSAAPGDPEAEAFAFRALELMLAVDPKVLDDHLDSMGERFRAVASNQAVAMLFAHLDAFLADTIRTICRARPEVLRNKKQITWEAVLKHNSLDDIASELTEQFVYEFGWKCLQDRLAALYSMGVSIPRNDDELRHLSLYEQRRHVIIHNGGVVSRKYLEEADDPNAVLGVSVTASDEDLGKLCSYAKLLAGEVFEAVALKFLPVTRNDLTQVWRRADPSQNQAG